MKYQLLLLLIVSLFIACDQTEKSDDTAQENVNLVDSLYISFAAGDVETVLGAMSVSIVWNEAENFIYADMNPYVGPQSVAEGVFQRLSSEWEYWKIKDPKTYAVGENMVLTLGRYLAKNKASGKTLDAQFAHLWTLEDGKVVAFQQFTDTKQAADVVLLEAEEIENDTLSNSDI